MWFSHRPAGGIDSWESIPVLAKKFKYTVPSLHFSRSQFSIIGPNKPSAKPILLLEWVLRIRDVYPGTGFFSLADPGQWIKQQQKRGGEKISYLIFI
jgi:hypothetical protein